jgi:TRAP-type C4-dicarboxylate transport system permease large subunit
VPGGLGHVNVLAGMLFAGMPGSAVADAAELGVVEIKAMREAGYTPRFAATLTAVSSTIGPIIPPSMSFVIYGSLANVSVGALFLAWSVPGALLSLCLIAVVAVVAKRQDLPMRRARPAAAIALRIVAAAPFGWLLIQQRISNAVLRAVPGVLRQPWVLLLIIHAALLVLGMFIEGIAILIIGLPVLLPILTAIGIDPALFGVIVVLKLMIGPVTLPVGVCLYVVSSTSKMSMTETSAESRPYLLALLVVLGVITFMPTLSLWLPNALGYEVVR